MINVDIVKNCLSHFKLSDNQLGKFFSIKKLADQGFERVMKLPMSLKIILESLIRNYDDNIVTAEHILSLINWVPGENASGEIPFFVARIILQDYSGLPLLNDMSAMRDALEKLNKSPLLVNPVIPTSLVIDHTTETNHTGKKNALQLNMEIEFYNNQERYQFFKWAATAFNNLKIIPPGSGIIHQINLEYLVKGIFSNSAGVFYPDTLVGTDSHTTMSNGIGIVGWGVGGIEAETAMLGAPILLAIPDVVGVHLSGQLNAGVTATDLTLTITEILRKANIEGKIVEYFGSGVTTLTAQERATIANMAPDYGAMMGLFPIDERTIQYYYETGREPDAVVNIHNYYNAQMLFGVPQLGDCNYGRVINIHLNDIRSSIAGPKRPQDRINLECAKSAFDAILIKSKAEDGYGYPDTALNHLIKFNNHGETVAHGDIIIAAITSCTNTSNPYLLMTAGLLAKKACQKGLRVKSHIKTSLAPGSKAVTEYLEKAGLLEYLERLGFFLAGYGCTTCVGNVGEINQDFEKVVKDHNLVVSSVLSGNRNFEARIHSSVRANFLMSPPLVIAFSIAGTIRINLLEEALGVDQAGLPVFLKDIWPSSSEIEQALQSAMDPSIYQQVYHSITQGDINWKNISTQHNAQPCYAKPNSSFITKPPFFENFSIQPTPLSDIYNARALLILGDSITTDHISPVGKIDLTSPSGQYLLAQGVLPQDLGNYGARRGNHEVMLRGTFANVRLRNKILHDVEGAYTINMLTNQQASIYETAMEYQKSGIASIVFAGTEYGSGSARDWAAKGTQLLGIKVVIANSFERIHRSNLVGMGIIPCQLKNGMKVEDLKLTGFEKFDILGIETLKEKRELSLLIKGQHSNNTQTLPLVPRLDNDFELAYIYHGGIMLYTLRELLSKNEAHGTNGISE
ncbi:MAG: aconitate hydratase AcnA [Pseudomonadota bacterium]